MKIFRYVRVSSAKKALKEMEDQGAYFLAGGTNIHDLMKRQVAAPEKLIDINNLPLKSIEYKSGTMYINALASNSDVAENNIVQEKFPLLSMALKAGASPQIRNMATVGGNMMQRTRCQYFYDIALPCNKREPGTGCGALEGLNHNHAIFGTSSSCIATHPSDMCVALTALDATVILRHAKGTRKIPFAEFHRLPGDTPQKDNHLAQGEMIEAIEIPENPFIKNVHYLKVRERSSYAFALVSVAAALHIENGLIKNARLAMGGVAHKPWRLPAVESALIDQPVSEDTFRLAAEMGMEGAKAYKHNAYKLTLTPNAIVQALKNAAEIS